MEVLGATEFGPARSVLSFCKSDGPLPLPSGPTQVRIRVTYAELNPVDHHKLGMKPDGTAVPKDKSPFVVGYGGSGVVDAVGAPGDGDDGGADEATRSLMGKRVVFLVNPAGAGGSYGTHVLVDRRTVAVVPDVGVDDADAACIPVAGCTAYESLEKAGLSLDGLRGGDVSAKDSDAGAGRTLLVVGGAGGVGSWTTLLARAAYPSLRIACTASSAESAEWCQSMGANDVIMGHEKAAEVLGGGRNGSVDHVVCLADPTPSLFGSMAEALRPYGKICLVVAGEGIKSLDLGFVFFKSGTVATETVFSSIRAGYRLDQAAEMETILLLLAKGRIKRAPLADEWQKIQGTINWKEALADGGCIDVVGSGHCRGKLVMKINN
eukprot:CAMPEP_0113553762 /NCGR_PEP_ID=MMETSP0015_2-20120614/15788_1 /TAXON_ID=2838 /ORGANISM="Odontella" /LENGTH=378 /DNA_ID=CAMNT_0000454857 /DNA_START=137 /DNA_END=1273 /DNA_ORIENTATION=+ /assembly_acc=CAM_ASM_000160